MITVLIAGDIVGAPGRRAFAQVATRFKERGQVDFVIANAENAAGGSGITQALAEELLAAGADVLTLGDHTWRQKQIMREIGHVERLLRPANFTPDCPGRGSISVQTKAGSIMVINLIGRVFMDPVDCPFRKVDELIGKASRDGKMVFVDMHAEATSEKIAMGRHLDARVSAVTGTHTHVQTADERILPGGTAYITDIGMTGSKDSVLGREYEPVVQSFVTGLPAHFDVATENVVLEGVLVRVDEKTGRARDITRLQESV